MTDRPASSKTRQLVRAVREVSEAIDAASRSIERHSRSRRLLLLELYENAGTYEEVAEMVGKSRAWVSKELARGRRERGHTTARAS